jgi:hypothetical protein
MFMQLLTDPKFSCIFYASQDDRNIYKVAFQYIENFGVKNFGVKNFGVNPSFCLKMMWRLAGLDFSENVYLNAINIFAKFGENISNSLTFTAFWIFEIIELFRKKSI